MNSFLDEVETFFMNSRLKKDTLRQYSSCLNNFLIFLSKYMDTDKEDIFLDKVYLEIDLMGIPIRYLPLDSTLLEEYLNSLIPKGFYTLHRHHSSLKSFFTFLERNYNFQSPFNNLEFRLSQYYPEEKYKNILTRSGIIRFINKLVKNSDNLETELLLFTILLSTGCRISEVLNLQYEDLDALNDSFKLKNTKNKHQRIVNLRPGIGNLIDIYARNLNRTATDCLFQNKKNQKFLRTEVDNLLKKYLELAQLPPINLHGFRHTFATLMADEEISITVIQQLLGHKSIESTMGYINPNYVRNKNFKVKENEMVWESFRKLLNRN